MATFVRALIADSPLEDRFGIQEQLAQLSPSANVDPLSI
jgi:hypothetical protein